MCDLSDCQAGEGHRCQESVCAPFGHCEGYVMHISPRQQQSIIEEEEAHVSHMFKGPDQECLQQRHILKLNMFSSKSRHHC